MVGGECVFSELAYGLRVVVGGLCNSMPLSV